MIDYSKLRINEPNIDSLLNNPILEFKREVSEKTGLLETHAVCMYHHCKIKVYDSGTVLFLGSIHKMYNSLIRIVSPKYNKHKEYTGYNGNQFYYHEIKYVLQHLTILFDVDYDQMVFQNIELGVNLTTYFDPQVFISGLLFFEGKAFDYRYNGFYAQSVHSQYIVKVYNKSNQYEMKQYTLRFEMKIIKMEFQKSVGIWTAADISHHTLAKAFDFIERSLIKTIYYDNTIDLKVMNNKSKIDCKDFSNIRYWQNTAPNKRDRPKKKLQKFIQEYSRNIKNELLNQLIEYRVKFDRLFESQKCVISDQLFEKPKCVIFDHSNIGANIINKGIENRVIVEAKKESVKNGIFSTDQVKEKKKLTVNEVAKMAAKIKWENPKKAREEIRKGWSNRKKRINDIEFNKAYSPQERKDLSLTKTKASNNLALTYIRELGILPSRTDGFHKALRKLVVNDYKTPENFYLQYSNVINQVFEKGFDLNIEHFTKEVNRTRLLYQLKIYLVDQNIINELTQKTQLVI